MATNPLHGQNIPHEFESQLEYEIRSIGRERIYPKTYAEYAEREYRKGLHSLAAKMGTIICLQK